MSEAFRQDFVSAPETPPEEKFEAVKEPVSQEEKLHEILSHTQGLYPGIKTDYPGLLRKRIEKISALPSPRDLEQAASPLNNIVTSDTGLVPKLHAVVENKRLAKVEALGKVKTPENVSKFIDDVCDLFPRFLASKGLKTFKRFGQEQVCFVDISQGKDEDTQLLGDSDNGTRFCPALMLPIKQKIFAVHTLFEDPLELMHTIVHELTHVFGYMSDTAHYAYYTNASGLTASVALRRRRVGLAAGISSEKNEFGVPEDLGYAVSSLNEAMTERFTNEFIAEYHDLFPYFIDGIKKVTPKIMVELEKKQKEEGLPARLKLVPYDVEIGSPDANWIGVKNYASALYAQYFADFVQFVESTARVNAKNPNKVAGEIEKYLDDAYLNGAYLPLFRYLKQLGVHPKDIIGWDLRYKKAAPALDPEAKTPQAMV